MKQEWHCCKMSHPNVLAISMTEVGSIADMISQFPFVFHLVFSVAGVRLEVVLIHQGVSCHHNLIARQYSAIAIIGIIIKDEQFLVRKSNLFDNFLANERTFESHSYNANRLVAFHLLSRKHVVAYQRKD